MIDIGKKKKRIWKILEDVDDGNLKVSAWPGPPPGDGGWEDTWNGHVMWRRGRWRFFKECPFVGIRTNNIFLQLIKEGKGKKKKLGLGQTLSCAWVQQQKREL